MPMRQHISLINVEKLYVLYCWKIFHVYVRAMYITYLMWEQNFFVDLFVGFFMFLWFIVGKQDRCHQCSASSEDPDQIIQPSEVEKLLRRRI